MEFHRRSIRLKEYDYSSYGWYFVTICAQDRELYFGNVENGCLKLSKFGEIAQKYLLQIPEHFQNTEIDEYIVMPNHIHAVIIIENDNSVGVIHELPLQNGLIQQSPEQWREWFKQRRQMLLPKIIGWFKMNSAKQINILLNQSGIPLWQRNYYERIIRNNKELNRIRQYIISNPDNWETDRNNPKNFNL
ncbi:MAG: transposase [Candidatus Portnoybacteria bacterium CG23_combo_of_CG06-09_8_20_14_all_37_13]|uniref:Transposase n=1 Tax=Candidatus Portnoybacteria bacterium CG23_combo_of_CG06-09_8_20_14_all_37_13 TaxID=1974819 RepID=A0A2G9YDM0_9BACT|nr:MAG: transposase [Candidatus Portnoybacteria bacterium CG23_combo_of_CG06-09_8_20_14_all_37_13]